MTARTVGVVGAGQLARMMAEAASQLGIDMTVLAADDEESCVPALTARRADQTFVAGLESFVAGVDVVTFDHERVDVDQIEGLERDGVLVFPSAAALRFSDKAHQRQELHRRGLPTPRFTIVRQPDDALAFGAEAGWPVVLKPAQGGYDGKGVHIVDDPDAASALLDHGALAIPWVAEEHLAIDAEIAVVVVTARDGGRVHYPVVRTVQHGGVCREVTAPARLAPGLSDAAEALALDVASVVGAVGVLAVELFLVDGELLVNEVAPRPHNSGHITIEANATSQFENHLRAVLGWPLGSPTPRAPAAAMVNVFGPPDGSDPRAAAPHALTADVHLHLYGKSPRPGRKLGHVTALAGDVDSARSRAWAAAAALGTSPPDDVPGVAAPSSACSGRANRLPTAPPTPSE